MHSNYAYTFSSHGKYVLIALAALHRHECLNTLRIMYVEIQKRIAVFNYFSKCRVCFTDDAALGQMHALIQISGVFKESSSFSGDFIKPILFCHLFVALKWLDRSVRVMVYCRRHKIKTSSLQFSKLKRIHYRKMVY